MLKSLTPQESYNYLENDDAILIDVREQNEYDECCIASSILVPLSCLVAEIQETPLPKDKKIIVYCLKGGRSAQAIEFLQENILRDHTEVYNMTGGILGWIRDDLPVIKGR